MHRHTWAESHKRTGERGLIQIHTGPEEMRNQYCSLVESLIVDQSAQALTGVSHQKAGSLMCRLSLNFVLIPGAKIITEKLKAETCSVA